MNHEFAQDNTPCMLGRERFREHSRPQCAVVGADLLLLAVGLLHKRVNEHTHHGDGRAGDTDRRHGRAKSNGSGDLGGGRGGGDSHKSVSKCIQDLCQYTESTFENTDQDDNALHGVADRLSHRGH
jgi:hypothetical protein